MCPLLRKRRRPGPLDTRFPSAHCIKLDAATLRAWPLPPLPPLPSGAGDKQRRGHLLIVGGSREMPAAVILAATAALGAGAGNLTVATGASVAQLVALALPQACVIGLAETAHGGFEQDAFGQLDPLAGQVSAILIGPGMRVEAASAALVRALLPRFERSNTSVVLDACAMGVIPPPSQLPGGGAPFRFSQPVIVLPHTDEMAQLCGESIQAICDDPDRQAALAARRWNAVVALTGARSVVSAPTGERWQLEGGNIGLANAGSGDALAGIIAGLAARGADLAQAACWGVALHARAAELLAGRLGTPGYPARELPDEIPALMARLARA